MWEACFVVIALAVATEWSYEACAEPARTHITSEQIARYGQVADRAIEALIKGDAKTFKSMLSPVTMRMEQRGANAIDLIISDRFIPFFSDYLKPGTSDQTFPTYRRLDNVNGVGFARSFLARDASERFFVIFILEEGGAPVVGNLMLNKKYSDFN